MGTFGRLSVLVGLLLCLTATYRGPAAVQAEETELALISISAPSPDTPQHGILAGFSEDGTRVFVETLEQLVAADTDASNDVYQWMDGAVTLISISAITGEPAADTSFGGASADGQSVFFETSEKMVTGDDDGGLVDVYRRLSGVTTLVSETEVTGETPVAASYSGSSASGDIVFFVTEEKLVAADGDALTDIYQRAGTTTTLVSTTTLVGELGWEAFYRGNSVDGTRVFFVSSEKLVAGDTDTSQQDIYEFSGATVALVSESELTGEAEQHNDFLGASEDGTRVFFETEERMAAPDGDSGGSAGQDVYERSGGTTKLVSASALTGEAPDGAFFEGASSDGTHVFFTTGEKLVTADDDGGFEDVYERSGGVTTLVSVSTIAGELPSFVQFDDASADGSTVMFSTQERMATADTDGGIVDVYVRSGNVTELVSQGDPGHVEDVSVGLAMSDDGSRYVFLSLGQVTDDDTDGGFIDVYSRTGGVTTLVTGPGAAGESTTHHVIVAEVSDDARRVFFMTTERLVSSDTDALFDVYGRLPGPDGFADPESSAAEGAGTVNVGVELDEPRAGTATVEYEVTGGTAGAGDFSLPAGTLTFTPGQTNKSIPVTIMQDPDDEADETIEITLETTNAVTPATTHTLTIRDDDPARVGFAKTTSAAAEGRGTLLLDVALTRPQAGTVTVGYTVTSGTARRGKDYKLKTGTLSFAPGETAKTIAVAITQDFLVEPSEIVRVTLLSPSGASRGRLIHTLTIRDDERRAKCGGEDATIVGTTGNDTLAGTGGADVIVARAGRDTIRGNAGNDVICASPGNDTVSGGTGNDVIAGGDGNDRLDGNNGTDQVSGGEGNDKLAGAAGGGDGCEGGPGNDVILPKGGCETAQGVP